MTLQVIPEVDPVPCNPDGPGTGLLATCDPCIPDGPGAGIGPTGAEVTRIPESPAPGSTVVESDRQLVAAIATTGWTGATGAERICPNSPDVTDVVGPVEVEPEVGC